MSVSKGIYQVPSDVTQLSLTNSVDLLRELNVNPQTGLTLEQVAQLQKKYGLNKIRKSTNPIWQVLFRQISSPFFIILLVAAVLSFWLKEKLDAFMVGLFILVNTLIGFIEEFHAAKTLQMLEKFTTTSTTVRRGGVEQVVDVSRLVPGDIVLIQSGDVIPADLRLLSEHEILIDESILTGESVQVTKIIEENVVSTQKDSEGLPTNICFAGTSVVGGSGEGVVVAIGGASAIGQINRLVNTTVHPNQMQENLHKLSMILFSLAVCTIGLLLFLHFTLRPQQNFTELVLFFIALLIGIIPEALPVVMTFAFSRGARVLAKEKVVVKHLNAVEELGNIEVLCSDKTGTLTENQMQVHEVLNVAELSPAIWGFAASKIPYHHTLRIHPEAFDRALMAYLEKERPEHQFSHFELLDLIPFDPHQRTQFALVKYLHKLTIIVRGAPEVVLEMCQPFKQKEEFHNWELQNGSSGYRSLAVACLEVNNQEDWEKHQTGFTAIGVISFVDPLRASAKASILEAEKLGVKVKILTGDSAVVAGFVGKEVGLIQNANQVMHGKNFALLSPEEKARAVETATIFARVTPVQKHEIIKLLQANGHTVGFVGDGINDAPALKQAHVALTVSGASDIAQDAADIILLHRSLSTIVSGIQEGRIIFVNVMKCLRIILSSTFGNFFTLAIASLFTSALPMLPVQILLLNLLTDFPMIAIASDRVDPEDLVKPVAQDIHHLIKVLVLFGILSTLFDLIFLSIFFSKPITVLQTGWFVFSVLTELVFIFTIRTQKAFWRTSLPSTLLLILIIFAAVAAVSLPLTYIGHFIFRFSSLPIKEIVFIMLLTCGYLLANELLKKIPFLKTK